MQAGEEIKDMRRCVQGLGESAAARRRWALASGEVGEKTPILPNSIPVPGYRTLFGVFRSVFRKIPNFEHVIPNAFADLFESGNAIPKKIPHRGAG
jgi:hypothetical protein